MERGGACSSVSPVHRADKVSGNRSSGAAGEASDPAIVPRHGFREAPGRHSPGSPIRAEVAGQAVLADRARFCHWRCERDPVSIASGLDRLDQPSHPQSGGTGALGQLGGLAGAQRAGQFGGEPACAAWLGRRGRRRSSARTPARSTGEPVPTRRLRRCTPGKVGPPQPASRRAISSREHEQQHGSAQSTTSPGRRIQSWTFSPLTLVPLVLSRSVSTSFRRPPGSSGGSG